MFEQSYIESLFKKDSEGHTLFLKTQRWYIVGNEQYINHLKTLINKKIKYYDGILEYMLFGPAIIGFCLVIIDKCFSTKMLAHHRVVVLVGGPLAAIIFLASVGMGVVGIFYYFKGKTLYKKLNLVKTDLPKSKPSLKWSSSILTFRRLSLLATFACLGIICCFILFSWPSILFFLIILTLFLINTIILIIIKMTNKQKGLTQ